MIKRERIINAKKSLPKGWALDNQALFYHSELVPSKIIHLDDTHFLKVTVKHDKGGLNYFDYKTYPSEFYLHISLYESDKDSDFATSHGLGQNLTLEVNVPRDNFKKRCKLAELFDDDSILALADFRRLNNPFVI